MLKTTLPLRTWKLKLKSPAEGIGMMFLICLVVEGTLFIVMDAYTISKQMLIRNIRGRLWNFIRNQCLQKT